MVRVQALLADRLGIRRWRNVIGGSMGGMQALEWATMYPGPGGQPDHPIARPPRASARRSPGATSGAWPCSPIPICAGATTTTPSPARGPTRASPSPARSPRSRYRSRRGVHRRFGRRLVDRLDVHPRQRFDVEGYLDYHGAKLVRRFDANSYLELNQAMDLHDLGRGRGGAANALARVRCPTLVAARPLRRPLPALQQRSLYDHLRGPRCRRHLVRHRLPPRPRRLPDRDGPARSTDLTVPRTWTRCMTTARS